MPRPKPPPEPSAWVLRADLLVLFGVSMDKLRQFIERHGFPRGSVITKKLVYFTIVDVHAWIAAHRELLATEAAASAARKAQREKAGHRIARRRPDLDLESDLLRGY